MSDYEIKDSVGSEYGADPETDSPEVENEEDYVDDSDDDDNSDWEGDDDFDESATPTIERPTAPSADEYQDQESYDADFEIYLREAEDYQSQMPGQRDVAELDNEIYNELDRIGLAPTAKVDARKAIAAADNFLVKAINADLCGNKGEARDARMRGEYMARSAQEEMAKDSLAQKKGKEIALHTAEAVIRNARSMDSNEYASRFPQGRGYEIDAKEAISAFNNNTQGDYVYVARKYSPLNPDLSEAPRGLTEGSQLMRVRVPSHFDSGKDLAIAARSSGMTVWDYLVQTGGVNIKPMETEEEETEDQDRFRGMSHKEYRRARGLDQKTYNNRLYNAKKG